MKKVQTPPVRTKAAAPNKQNGQRKKLLNKKSRERYLTRRYNEKLNRFTDHPESRNVVNLSSIELSQEELFALELGHGFVVSPNNPLKEEEILLLEGFRFLDRLEKANYILSKLKHCENNLEQTVIPDTAICDTAIDSELFHRNNFVPYKLQFSQPKEPTLMTKEAKMVKAEFDELNGRLIDNCKLKSTKIKFNLPRRCRDALKNIKKLAKDKIIDVRKADNGQLILIVD